MNLRWGEWQKSSLMISQLWFSLWLGVVRQEASVDQALCHHMATLGQDRKRPNIIDFGCGAHPSLRWEHFREKESFPANYSTPPSAVLQMPCRGAAIWNSTAKLILNSNLVKSHLFIIHFPVILANYVEISSHGNGGVTTYLSANFRIDLVTATDVVD